MYFFLDLIPLLLLLSSSSLSLSPSSPASLNTGAVDGARRYQHPTLLPRIYRRLSHSWKRGEWKKVEEVLKAKVLFPNHNIAKSKTSFFSGKSSCAHCKTFQHQHHPACLPSLLRPISSSDICTRGGRVSAPCNFHMNKYFFFLMWWCASQKKRKRKRKEEKGGGGGGGGCCCSLSLSLSPPSVLPPFSETADDLYRKSTLCTVVDFFPASLHLHFTCGKADNRS